MIGGTRVATKAAYNLLGGSVEYDVDFSKNKAGINANVYTISPSFSGAYDDNTMYCDGAMPEDGSVPWCMEVDWIEGNGNCGGATTIHTVAERGGKDFCGTWGCQSEYSFNGKTIFHMTVTYGTDGSWTVKRDGQTIQVGEGQDWKPSPSAKDWAIVKSTMESKGSVIVSSVWTAAAGGWLPANGVCGNGTGTDVAGSTFAVRNLKITGSITNGPPPTVCGADLETETIVV